jgi:hypothetical protein
MPNVTDRERAMALEAERELCWYAIRRVYGITHDDLPLAISQTLSAARASERAHWVKVLRVVDDVLRVPAAEYVPAIRHAWEVIDAAIRSRAETEGK